MGVKTFKLANVMQAIRQMTIKFLILFNIFWYLFSLTMFLLIVWLCGFWAPANLVFKAANYPDRRKGCEN